MTRTIRGSLQKIGDKHVVLLSGDALEPVREMVRRRLLYSGMEDRPFSELWPRICASHVAGEESSQHLIDRCLMRPQALIDLAIIVSGSL